jgi:hypothetical protein
MEWEETKKNHKEIMGREGKKRSLRGKWERRGEKKIIGKDGKVRRKTKLQQWELGARSLNFSPKSLY